MKKTVKILAVVLSVLLLSLPLLPAGTPCRESIAPVSLE